MDIEQSKKDLDSYMFVHYLKFPDHKNNIKNKLKSGHKIIDCFHCDTIIKWKNFLKDK